MNRRTGVRGRLQTASELVPEDELDFGCPATHTIDMGCGIVCHLDPGHDGDHHDKWAGLVWRPDDGLDV